MALRSWFKWWGTHSLSYLDLTESKWWGKTWSWVSAHWANIFSNDTDWDFSYVWVNASLLSPVFNQAYHYFCWQVKPVDLPVWDLQHKAASDVRCLKVQSPARPFSTLHLWVPRSCKQQASRWFESIYIQIDVREKRLENENNIEITSDTAVVGCNASGTLRRQANQIKLTLHMRRQHKIKLVCRMKPFNRDFIVCLAVALPQASLAAKFSKVPSHLQRLVSWALIFDRADKLLQHRRRRRACIQGVSWLHSLLIEFAPS